METPVRRIPALDVDCRITRTAPPTARPGVHAGVLAECPAMHDLLAPLIHWYLETLDQGGYLLIGLLMAMESSIIPLPSEFVIPPAAYLAQAKGTFTYTGIVIAGTVGSWVGASVMYWLSRMLGRPLLMRYGRYVLITPEKIERAEAGRLTTARWACSFRGSCR